MLNVLPEFNYKIKAQDHTYTFIICRYFPLISLFQRIKPEV